MSMSMSICVCVYVCIFVCVDIIYILSHVNIALNIIIYIGIHIDTLTRLVFAGVQDLSHLPSGGFSSKAEPVASQHCNERILSASTIRPGLNRIEDAIQALNRPGVLHEYLSTLCHSCPLSSRLLIHSRSVQSAWRRQPNRSRAKVGWKELNDLRYERIWTTISGKSEIPRNSSRECPRRVPYCK